MVTNMKQTNTLKHFFSPEQRADAMAVAPDVAVADDDNPATTTADWKGAIKTHGGGVAATLAELRRVRGQRGVQKAPKKVATALRMDETALARWRASGKGWQTRAADLLAKYAP